VDVLLAVGSAIVVVGLFMGLIEAHVRRLEAWSRPRWALAPTSRRLFPYARRAVLASGVVVLFLGSIPVAVTVAAGLISIAWWMRWVRSPGYAERRLGSELARWRRDQPGVDDAELLGRILMARHPDWGEDLVARMIRDNPEPAALARIVTRMERGWDGI
jgi:hypothetical protein